MNSLDEAKKIIYLTSIPLVVKADGLASSKGVFIPDSKDECFRAAESISMVSLGILEMWSF